MPLSQEGWQVTQAIRDARRARHDKRFALYISRIEKNDLPGRNPFERTTAHPISRFKPEDKITSWLGHIRRNHRMLVAPGSHTVEQWMERVERFGWLCRYCCK